MPWDQEAESPRERECFDLMMDAAFGDDEPDTETVDYWRDEGLKARQARLFAEPVVIPPPPRRRRKVRTVRLSPEDEALL
jgi:hypothetical protein